MHHKLLANPDAKRQVNGRSSESPTDLLPTIRSVVITCSSDCFPPDQLAAKLNDGEWLMHRVPAAILPPLGVSDGVEDQLLERLIADRGIARLVICGHTPCECAAQLLTPDSSSRHDRAVRRTLASLPERDERIAAERAVLAQTANLLTHPAVAAAVASNRLSLHSWLYDTATDELLYPAAGETRFTRLVALQPSQNVGLRRDFIHRTRPRDAVWVFDRAKLELA